MTEQKVELSAIENHEKMRTACLHRDLSLDSNDSCKVEREIMKRVRHVMPMLLTAREWEID